MGLCVCRIASPLPLGANATKTPFAGGPSALVASPFQVGRRRRFPRHPIGPPPLAPKGCRSSGSETCSSCQIVPVTRYHRHQARLVTPVTIRDTNEATPRGCTMSTPPGRRAPRYFRQAGRAPYLRRSMKRCTNAARSYTSISRSTASLARSGSSVHRTRVRFAMASTPARSIPIPSFSASAFASE